MSRASEAAHKKRLGKRQIDESNASTPIRDILSTKADRRQERLDLARAGTKNRLEGTITTNRLKRLKRVLDRQSTDSNN